MDSAGNLRVGVHDDAPSLGEPPSSYVIGTQTTGASPAPISAAPISDIELDRLAELLHSARSAARGALVITGAGCSTESNVPDYRGPGGAYSLGYKPMTHQQFMSSNENRSRYWARSFAGYAEFARLKPNPAHHSLAWLQNTGFVSGIITQNVDRLHHKAGSPRERVLELHGTTHEVICMTCRTLTPRGEVQRWLAHCNPAAAAAVDASTNRDSESGASGQLGLIRAHAGTSDPKVPQGYREGPDRRFLRPDGDVEVSPNEPFVVPPCPSCGGILKPDVVFFGDSLPQERALRALHEAQNATGVLIVGSSLAVWSAFRLVKAARDNGATIGILNVGTTRADEIATWKVEARAGDAMDRLKQRLES